ncbi:MAG: aldo/keto reductase [Acidimicrobiia bacterium]
MRAVRFGTTGLHVSELCLGTMTFGHQCDEETSRAILDSAFDRGITFLDTADVYPLGGPPALVGRTEEIVGRWMQGKRDQVILATKCVNPTGPQPWQRGASRQHVIEAVDASLRRLGTDHIDLYQLHRPDPHTPIDETLGALADVVRAGKVRYLGCSNFLAYQVARALGRSEALGLPRFDSVQPRYNLISRQAENELLPLCTEDGLAVIPYNPLAGGLLSGKHLGRDAPAEGTRFALPGAGDRYQVRYWNDGMFDAVEAVRKVADDLGIPMVELALAWVMANPAVTAPIIGVSRPDQLDACVRATAVALPAEAKAKLDELTDGFRFVEAAR